MIGVVGGLHPIVAGIAAAVGNFLCVLLVVLLTSRARAAVVNHRTARVAATGESAGAPESAADATVRKSTPAKPESKGRRRFKKALVRFGVPGASILGPLAVPTQVMSAMLVAGGTSRARVLLWQAVAIVLWTTVATVSTWLALQLVVSV